MPVQPQVLFLVEEQPVATNTSVIRAKEVIFIICCIIVVQNNNYLLTNTQFCPLLLKILT